MRRPDRLRDVRYYTTMPLDSHRITPRRRDRHSA